MQVAESGALAVCSSSPTANIQMPRRLNKPSSIWRPLIRRAIRSTAGSKRYGRSSCQRTPDLTGGRSRAEGSNHGYKFNRVSARETFARLLATNAQAMHKNVRRHPHAVEDASQARRSDLVPGTSATVSSENHYFSDTARYSYSQSGPSISSERLDLPGAPDPLFRF